MRQKIVDSVRMVSLLPSNRAIPCALLFPTHSLNSFLDFGITSPIRKNIIPFFAMAAATPVMPISPIPCAPIGV
jgi:hypothetical protein